MPGGLPGGMLKLRFDWYIIVKDVSVRRLTVSFLVLYQCQRENTCATRTFFASFSGFNALFISLRYINNLSKVIVNCNQNSKQLLMRLRSSSEHCSERNIPHIFISFFVSEKRQPENGIRLRSQPNDFYIPL